MKKKRVILIAGFAVVAVSLIAFVAGFLYFWSGMPDPFDQRVFPFLYYFLFFPVIGEELVLFRCVYLLVCAGWKGVAKIFCLAAAAVILCALAFQALTFSGVITATDLFPEGPVAAYSRLLLLQVITERPLILFCLVLLGIGGWRAGKTEKNEGAKSDET